MSQQDADPIQPKTCPECCKNDRTVDATDRQIAADPSRPYWCERCTVPFKGSLHEFDMWQARKAAAKAERDQIANRNRTHAEATRPKETDR